MKTSKLTGAALDWAVAKCEGAELLVLKYGVSPLQYDINGRACWGTWSPSTDWSLAGPIIEREKISVICYDGGWRATNGTGVVEEAYSFEHGCERTCTGPTPLIAAMRCYVASKLGDEVEIPKELK